MFKNSSRYINIYKIIIISVLLLLKDRMNDILLTTDSKSFDLPIIYKLLFLVPVFDI